VTPGAGVRPQSDAESRRIIRESLDESLLVEASAGTGKTTELVNRIVQILATGRATIDRIAAVTFTNKAAGELKLRVREQLDVARQAAKGQEREALEDALERLEEAAIGTIHSFCAQILRERPVEAGVDPAFQELSEPEANRLYQQAFRSWLEHRLNEPSPALRRAFARLARRDSWDDSPALERLSAAGRKLVEWRDYPTPWHEEPFAREEEITTLLRMVRELAVASASPRRVTDNLFKGLQPARALAGWLDRAETAGNPDFDALEGLLLKLGRDLRRDLKKGSGEYGGQIKREDLVAQRDELLQWMEEFKQRADQSLAVQLREEMLDLVEAYNQRKRAVGKLDFVDLLVAVRDLLRDQQDVRTYLHQRFSHLFLDEFQDTDPLQAEILFLLASDDPQETNWLKVRPQQGKLFLVGDPKQSIYRFRRADIDLYRKIRASLSKQGLRVLSLTQSFRSVPNIQQFINIAFETEMSTDVDSGHAEWAPLERFREDIPGRPSVIVLPVPRPYGKARIAVDPVKECLPDAIGAFIAWLISNENDWNIAARDIAVLFRKRNHGKTDLTRELVRALEARGVPHLVAGSKSFHHREEVETLRAALAAVEWPDDELSVYATLKGSLFAISDEQLFLYRAKYGRLHPFAKHEPSSDPVLQILKLLGELHRDRNRQPFAATVNALLEASRAHAGFLLRPGGTQILANVLRVADLARSYETSGGISFRGFVEELTAQAERAEAAEAPLLEEDSDGVRIMTVHSAKGLEFPVVILGDLMTGLSRREPEQYVNGEQRLCAVELLGCSPKELRDHASGEAARERAEGIRVAYVAATRARDMLVVPAIGDEAWPQDGWLSPLNKAIYPSRHNWRNSTPGPGCPKFGSSTVLSRPSDYDREGEISVRPGVIEAQQGSHEVVWWDPAALKLGEEAAQGIRQEDILRDDHGASLAQYLDWQGTRDRLLSQAATPRFTPFLASQASDLPPGDPVFVERITSGDTKRSVNGRRFGTLVHAMLRDVPLDASPTQIRKIAELNTRILGASPAELKAATAAVEAALKQPLFDRARVAERCHREYPIVLKLADGGLLEGILDLAFLEKGTWTIIDFKTDDDVAERSEQYERQLSWYAFGLRELTGKPVRPVLLSV
jgi:ATP-dependent exoDNAse (exonuclease V) beta subunit